jgi:hypothetical protein
MPELLIVTGKMSFIPQPPVLGIAAAVMLLAATVGLVMLHELQLIDPRKELHRYQLLLSCVLVDFTVLAVLAAFCFLNLARQ